jgi:hypothetical protein
MKNENTFMKSNHQIEENTKMYLNQSNQEPITEHIKTSNIQNEINNNNSTSKKKQKVNFREKRKKQYDDMAKEWANLNISEIRVEDLAEARKKEINQFNHILNNKFSSRVGFQTLPKHMRRRQMSHNPFRIPVRARIANFNANKSKCLKHKKKKT